ncbi:unnamed protein product [Symbiodinium sp. CCMP2592]|nr:unnamed protein product [Symbiodinium sp. CCMP2592]
MEIASSAVRMVSVFQELLPGMASQQGTLVNKAGRRHREHQESRRGSRGGQGHQNIRQEHVTQLISMVAAMSLQQEDALNTVRMDTSFTFRLRKEGPGAVLKELVQAGQKWHQMTNKGEQLGPLRLVAFGLLLKETEARLKLLLSSEEAQKKAVECHWVDGAGRFVYQKWNPIAKRLEVDTAKQGLTPTITKFSAKKRRDGEAEPEEGNTAVFTVEISLRSPAANDIHQQLLLLQDSAAWQLVGAQLRPPTLKRHGIAVALQKNLEEARK